MPREKQEISKIKNLCQPGRSFGCKTLPEHEKGMIADINCYRCSTRMGCSTCCERHRELLCLVCHNWATKAALEAHGDIVPNAKVYRVRTDKGWIKWDQKADIPAQVEALLKNPPF